MLVVNGTQAADILSSPLVHKDDKSVQREALLRCGLDPDSIPVRDYSITPRMTLRLPEEACESRHMHTNDVDVYKQWIGVPNSAAQASATMGPGEFGDPQSLSTVDFSGPLNAEARRQLAEIARTYIFGNGSALGAFKELIEINFAPFEAKLVRAGEITIQSGGQLLLCDYPLILIADKVDLHDGAQIISQSVAHVSVGQFNKHNGTDKQGGGDHGRIN